MGLKYHTPADLREPFARYSHAVEVPPESRLVFCSGQLGIAPDDNIPGDAAGQTRLCFDNITAILRAADMTLANIVRLNTYVTDRAHLAPYMAVRDTLFGDPPPTSTLMIVSGFARAEFVIEIEAIAAGPM